MFQENHNFYVWTDIRKTLTQAEHAIPSLYSIGHLRITRALEPLRPHYHRDKAEISVIVRGTQVYSVDGKDYTLHGGDTFFTRPNEGHDTGRYPQDACELFWMQIELSSPDNFLGLCPPYNRLFFDALSGYQKRRGTVSEQQLHLLKHAFYDLSAEETDKKRLGYAAFLFFLSGFLYQEETPRDISGEIQDAVRYIEAHLYEDIPIGQIARKSNLSEARFKAKFKEQLGMSPRHYINRLKIEVSKQLLTEGGRSMTDIAYFLGFSSSAYFSQVFKQFCYCSPSDYVRKLRDNSQKGGRTAAGPAGFP